MEEKSSYAEIIQYFNQTPRSDGYSPSELFHGRRVRSHLPTIDESVNVEKGKAKRELTDLVAKNSTRNHSPIRPLEVGDLVYRRHFDGKKTLEIENLCEVIEVRNHGESYYIKDLVNDRIYLRNRSWITPSESSLNEIHKAKNLKVRFDHTTYHSVIEGKVQRNERKDYNSCLRPKNSTIKNKRVQFDSSMVIARVELISWRNTQK